MLDNFPLELLQEVLEHVIFTPDGQKAENAVKYMEVNRTWMLVIGRMRNTEFHNVQKALALGYQTIGYNSRKSTQRKYIQHLNQVYVRNLRSVTSDAFSFDNSAILRWVTAFKGDFARLQHVHLTSSYASLAIIVPPPFWDKVKWITFEMEDFTQLTDRAVLGLELVCQYADELEGVYVTGLTAPLGDRYRQLGLLKAVKVVGFESTRTRDPKGIFNAMSEFRYLEDIKMTADKFECTDWLFARNMMRRVKRLHLEIEDPEPRGLAKLLSYAKKLESLTLKFLTPVDIECLLTIAKSCCSTVLHSFLFKYPNAVAYSTHAVEQIQAVLSEVSTNLKEVNIYRPINQLNSLVAKNHQCCW